MYFENEKININIFGFVMKNEEIKNQEVEEGCLRVSKKQKLIITEEDLKEISLIIDSFKKYCDFENILKSINN
jgi:hypothetical protein